MIPLFALAGMALLIIQCAPATREPHNIQEALKQACQKQFQINVRVKTHQESIGVLTYVDNLFEKKEHYQLIHQLALCMRNVLSRRGSDLRFFHITLRDNKSGVENRIIMRMSDIHKSLLGMISPQEFRNRIVFSPDNNLHLLGTKKIELFLDSLPSQDLQDILKVHPRLTLKIFSKEFFHHLLETSMKENSDYDILSLKTKAVSEDRMLFFCRVRHTFQPKENFEKSSFKYPSGSIINFIIGIENSAYLDIRISEIYTFQNKENGEIEKVPDVLNSYPPPASWNEEDFFLACPSLPDFLALLISQSITAEIRSRGEAKENGSNFRRIQGAFKQEKQKQTLHFIFRTNPQASRPALEDFEEIVQLSLNKIKQICRIYDFQDFTNIELFFPEQGIFRVIKREEAGL